MSQGGEGESRFGLAGLDVQHGGNFCENTREICRPHKHHERRVAPTPVGCFRLRPLVSGDNHG